MKYAEWNKLNDEQKRNAHWKHHPHIRMATLFSIVFGILIFVMLLRVFQNRRMHVNRKPNNKEAFAIAKAFVKDRVKLPGSASFSNNDFQSDIDTARNSYSISSYVNAQDSSGRFIKNQWQVQLSYTGGDWADKNSWKLLDINISTNTSK